MRSVIDDLRYMNYIERKAAGKFSSADIEKELNVFKEGFKSYIVKMAEASLGPERAANFKQLLLLGNETMRRSATKKVDARTLISTVQKWYDAVNANKEFLEDATGIGGTIAMATFSNKSKNYIVSPMETLAKSAEILERVSPLLSLKGRRPKKENLLTKDDVTWFNSTLRYYVQQLKENQDILVDYIELNESEEYGDSQDFSDLATISTKYISSTSDGKGTLSNSAKQINADSTNAKDTSQFGFAHYLVTLGRYFDERVTGYDPKLFIEAARTAGADISSAVNPELLKDDRSQDFMVAVFARCYFIIDALSSTTYGNYQKVLDSAYEALGQSDFTVKDPTFIPMLIALAGDTNNLKKFSDYSKYESTDIDNSPALNAEGLLHFQEALTNLYSAWLDRANDLVINFKNASGADPKTLILHNRSEEMLFNNTALDEKSFPAYLKLLHYFFEDYLHKAGYGISLRSYNQAVVRYPIEIMTKMLLSVSYLRGSWEIITENATIYPNAGVGYGNVLGNNPENNKIKDPSKEVKTYDYDIHGKEGKTVQNSINTEKQEVPSWGTTPLEGISNFLPETKEK